MIYQVAMQEVNLVTIKDIAKARDMKYGDALEGQVIGLSYKVLISALIVKYCIM